MKLVIVIGAFAIAFTSYFAFWVPTQIETQRIEVLGALATVATTDTIGTLRQNFNSVVEAITGSTSSLGAISALSSSTGNLIVGSSSNWIAKSVGVNTQCLVASSTAQGGVSWEACFSTSTAHSFAALQTFNAGISVTTVSGVSATSTLNLNTVNASTSALANVSSTNITVTGNLADSQGNKFSTSTADTILVSKVVTSTIRFDVSTSTFQVVGTSTPAASTTLTTGARKVQLTFQSHAQNSSSSGRCGFTFSVDGTRVDSTSGAVQFGLSGYESPSTTGSKFPVSVTFLTGTLTAGSHTFRALVNSADTTDACLVGATGQWSFMVREVFN